MLFILFSAIVASQYSPPMQPGAMHGVQTLQVVPMACEQILDPLYCKGPSVKPGYVCMWQENECEAVNPTGEANEANEAPEMESHCKILSSNQIACNAKPGCHFEDFECKMGDNFDEAIPASPGMHGGVPPRQPGSGFPPQPQHPGMSPPRHPGMMPIPPQQPAGMMPPPQQPGMMPIPQTPAGMMPSPLQPGMYPQIPPQHPAAPNGGSAVVLPTAHGMDNQPNQNGIPTGIRPPPHSGAAQAQGSVPQFCKSLPHVQCFGPAMTPGEFCSWDEEDAECLSVSENDIEAICERFTKDPKKCDQHENCFWDEFDFECSEIEFAPNGEPMNEEKPSESEPIFSTDCGNFQDVNSCAAQAHCFWDSTAGHAMGVCVNVIQAKNVCRVLDTAQHCSTNGLCHWRGTYCVPVAGLRSVHHSKTDAPEAYMPTEFEVGIAASVLGLLLGLFLAWIQSKVNHARSLKASNEDYRDIMMDINSQRVV